VDAHLRTKRPAAFRDFGGAPAAEAASAGAPG
jgi:hypothetical protein